VPVCRKIRSHRVRSGLRLRSNHWRFEVLAVISGRNYMLLVRLREMCSFRRASRSGRSRRPRGPVLCVESLEGRTLLSHGGLLGKDLLEPVAVASTLEQPGSNSKRGYPLPPATSPPVQSSLCGPHKPMLGLPPLNGSTSPTVAVTTSNSGPSSTTAPRPAG
jgi:hypothetical protein